MFLINGYLLKLNEKEQAGVNNKEIKEKKFGESSFTHQAGL